MVVSHEEVRVEWLLGSCLSVRAAPSLLSLNWERPRKGGRNIDRSHKTRVARCNHRVSYTAAETIKERCL